MTINVLPFLCTINNIAQKFGKFANKIIAIFPKFSTPRGSTLDIYCATNEHHNCALNTLIKQSPSKLCYKY